MDQSASDLIRSAASPSMCDESDSVEAGECCGVALVVLDQLAAACGPGEGSFHSVGAAGQGRALPPAVRRSAAQCPQPRRHLRLSRGVALIDMDRLDAVAGCILDVGGQTLRRSRPPTSAGVTCRASR